MKASDLPWWKWLLIAAVLLFVGLDGLVGITGQKASGSISVLFALAFILAGAILALVGLIRFLKWAWRE